MSRPNYRPAIVAALVVLSPLTACGSDSNSSSEGLGNDIGQLSSICPEVVVVQADWFPEAEHGATYQLLGDDYRVDSSEKSVRGSLIDPDGDDTGVDLEIRSGGAAIGFQPVTSIMGLDDSVMLGFVSTDAAALAFQDVQTTSVMAPLDKNPQVIMWDPETYPDVTSIADLGRSGITINVYPAPFLEVLTADGVITSEQLDPSYDGSPARFVTAKGAIAQQGFASSEPYLYQFEVPSWGRPLDYELIHDAGFEMYAQALAVRSDRIDEFRPCLTELVPMFQRSAIKYARSPERTNDLIVDVVDEFASTWIYSSGLAEYSVATQLDLGLVGNGTDGTLGNFDLERIDRVLDQLRDVGLDVPTDLRSDDLYTNEFIDPIMGL